MDNIFADEFVPNIEGASYHPKWVAANKNGDAPKWAAFRDAVKAYEKGDTLAVPGMATKYGRALVAAGKQHMSVTDIGSAPGGTPTPPPPTAAYFDEDWSTGDFQSSRWTYLNIYENPGYVNATTSGSPSGRVDVVADPAGGGGNAARCEIRDSDPPWYNDANVDKEEIATDVVRTFNQGSTGINYGDIRWFSCPIYLPYTATEKFEWATGGQQPYMSLFGFHPPNNFGWSAFHIGWEAWQFSASATNNVFLNIYIEGGVFPETTYGGQNSVYNLVRLTDGSGNRVLSNHNRWINLVWGMKFDWQTSGWFECWVDGTNVVPRINRPTMWQGYNASYWKYGLYNRHDATYPISGRSVIYFGHTQFFYDRPF